MPRPASPAELRKAVSKALRIRLACEPKLSMSQIARDLDVTRSAVHQWKSGKALPSYDRLAELVQRYGLTLHGAGYEFGPSAFPRKTHSENQFVQLPLTNLDQPAVIEIPGTNLKLKISSDRSEGVEISVKLELTA